MVVPARPARMSSSLIGMVTAPVPIAFAYPRSQEPESPAIPGLTGLSSESSRTWSTGSDDMLAEE
jgi:hypothetical protein